MQLDNSGDFLHILRMKKKCWFAQTGCRLLLACVFLSACPGPDPIPDLEPADLGKDAAPEDLPPPADLADGGGDMNYANYGFVAVGDTGKGNDGQKYVAHAIERICRTRGCAFVQLLGDNIYDSGVTSVTDPQWQTKFEIPYKNISVPFYAALGNHDYGANGAGTEFDKAKWEILYTASSTKWRMPANTYSYSYGKVDYFVLDTNLMMFGRDMDKQQAAYDNWLANSKNETRVVFGHHPYKSNGPHGNAGSYDGVPLLGNHIKAFIEKNVCGKVRAYISGHDHSRQLLSELCGGRTSLVVSGAGASATDLKGKNPTTCQYKSIGFAYVTVALNTLTMEFMDVDDRVDCESRL